MNNNKFQWEKLALVLLSLALMSGCATTQTQNGGPGDPLEPANRKVYKFNDSLDKYVMKPVAETYVDYTPKPVRTGITNFFDNLGYLNVILNDLLQGKFRQGLDDSARFFVNSTIGLGGLFDPASDAGLLANDEDLGQSFGVWGAGEGAFLIIPFYGPNSVRDVGDLITSALLSPLFYLTAPISVPLGAIDAINTRANFLEATEIRDEAALDPYTFTREAYRQRREYLIYDGNPPEDDFEFLDEAGEADPSLRID